MNHVNRMAIFTLLPISLSMVLPVAAPVAAQTVVFVDDDNCSPPDSDCCSDSGTPGCGDAACQAIVCGIDPFCCTQWHEGCADLALAFCGDLCVPTGGQGTELDPYCSIQTAIDNAVDTDEIVVAPGTYFETIDFLGKAIWLHSSDGPEVTIIDANVLAWQYASVVTCVSNEGPETVLEGFTITGGNANGAFPDNVGGGMINQSSSPTVTNCTFNGNSARIGGGMYNDSSNPTVTGCMFSGNHAAHGGGMVNGNSNPDITDCNFVNNVAGAMFTTSSGGGMVNGNSNPDITDCVFTGNTAYYGGGMDNQSSNPTITNCTFTGNHANAGGGINNIESSPSVTDCTFNENTATYGGGMYNVRGGPPPFHSGSNPIVTRCVFQGNDAGDGGGMSNSNSSPQLVGCTFDGNTGSFGGGMVSWGDLGSPIVTDCLFRGNDSGAMINVGGNPTVANCSFIANTADSGGSGMSNWSGTYWTVRLTMTNCTFSGNTATAVRFNSSQEPNASYLTMTNCILRDGGDEIASNVASDISVSYTNVQGGWPGTGNIDVDPLFVDPENGDFRLSPGSPCIDAGNNNAIADLTDTDLDGNPRFADDPATADTGCGVPVIVDMGAYEYQGIPATVLFGDVNGDGSVRVSDLIALIPCMGSDDPACCVADLDVDGEVGVSDLMLLIHMLVQSVPIGP